MSDMAAQKPATAARMYDYYLGGIHNFAADRDAARKLIAMFPHIPMGARANRAFLRRAVRHLAGAGVRQFLDIGSGIPTEGNVHEVAQALAPDARVVYVDIDPVAVAESQELLDGNDGATAIRGDLRSPPSILNHSAVRRLLDLTQPTALLLASVLHFVPDDAQARAVVARLVGALAPGSYLVISHAAAESFPTGPDLDPEVDGIYDRLTATSVKLRIRPDVEPFFGDVELVEPGLVWLNEWRPDPTEPAEEFAGASHLSGGWAGVGRKP
jgi:SAM-dependent methyltransferase